MEPGAALTSFRESPGERCRRTSIAGCLCNLIGWKPQHPGSVTTPTLIREGEDVQGGTLVNCCGSGHKYNSKVLGIWFLKILCCCRLLDLQSSQMPRSVSHDNTGWVYVKNLGGDKIISFGSKQLFLIAFYGSRLIRSTSSRICSDFVAYIRFFCPILRKSIRTGPLTQVRNTI